ncbi:MAG: amidohydrolase [bacterium]
MGVLVDADIVFLNGNIITMNNQQPRAQALAIKGEKIFWVGADEEVKQTIGPQTLVKDLKGMTVIPGFIESHNHTLMFALDLQAIDLSTVNYIAEILKLVKERADQQAEGTWIRGVGYNQNELDEKRHPTKYDLDKAAPKHLVCLRHTSAHGLAVNSLALAKAGIGRGTSDPPGGKIGRDESGEPNGLLFESPAMKLIEDIIPKPSPSEMVNALGLANQKFLAEGITSALDASVGSNDIPYQIAAYQEAIERGILKVRHNLAIWSEALVDYTHLEESLQAAQGKLFKLGLRTGLGNEKLRIGPFKIIVDGAFSTVTAATYEPYGANWHERSCGVLVIEPEKLKKLVSQIHDWGWQLSLHGIGDRAIDYCLEAIAAALKKFPREDTRPRLEHATMLTPKSMELIKKLKVIPVMQPAFIWELADNWFHQLGPERARKCKPFKTLLKNEIPIAFSSDRPVVNGAPLLGIHAAVNQKTRSGQDYNPEEKISVAEAIQCYTINGAYATGEEKIKGSLEVGKLADLVILEEDITKVPPAALKDISIVATIVGGEFCWERK